MPQSSRNAGKPVSGRPTIPGAWTLTYLKVGGQWVHLYRSVDKQGKTVESYLSRSRDVTAAKAFFRKALKPHAEPRE
jgi:transposase-like protein